MNRTTLHCLTPLAVLISLLLCSGSTQAAKEPKQVKQKPSSPKSQLMTADEMRKKLLEPILQESESIRLEDGSTLVRGQIHGPGGVRANVILPPMIVNPTINMQVGKDEEGNPIMMQDVIRRKFIDTIVVEELKARGYDFKNAEKRAKQKLEEYKKQFEDPVWQAQMQEKIRKNNEEINARFIRPGSNPELSRLLNRPDVTLRVEREGDKWVKNYYLDGKKLQYYDDRPKQEVTKPKPPTPMFTVTSELSTSKRQPGQEELGKKLRKPPTKAYVPVGQEDLRKDPLDQKSSKENVATPQDFGHAFDDVESLTQAMEQARIAKEAEGKSSTRAIHGQKEGGSSSNTNAKPGSTPARGGSSSWWNRPSSMNRVFDALFSVLGIGSAYAAEVDAPNKGRYTDFLRTLEDRHAKDIPQIAVPDSKVSEKEKAKINSIVEAIGKEHRRFVDETKKKYENDQQSKAQLAETKKEDQPTEASQIGKNTYKDQDGNTYTPSEFASAIVKDTQSLTKEEFEDDVRMITDLFKGRDNPYDAAGVLAEILETHPEIKTVIPDAEERLLEFAGIDLDGDKDDPMGKGSYIFVSYSLGDDVIKDIVRRNQHKKNVALVMRGVPEGMKFYEGVSRMQQLAKSVEPPVPLILDPTLFKEYGITKVPAVVRVGKKPTGVMMGEQKRRFAPMIAKVTGLHNDDWLMSKIEAGEKGDFGQQGNVKDIAEPDMIEVMKERVLAIDWEQKKQEAFKRFWSNQTFDVLPTAAEARSRVIDPSFVMKEDFKDLAGRPIRKKGERINPLAIRPFTKTLIVFNPVSEKEFKRVEAYIAEHKAKGKADPVIIGTQIDKSRNWDGYTSVTDRLDAHLFMLTPEVKTTWRIEKTPTIIEADNNKRVFLVTELGPLPDEEVEDVAVGGKPRFVGGINK